jgi:predicted dehydrogenase
MGGTIGLLSPATRRCLPTAELASHLTTVSHFFKESQFMSHGTNRRRFLQTSAVAGIGFWVAAGARAQECKSPNGKIAFASIGLGGKGSSDSSDAGNAGDMVAICDADENTLNNAGEKRFPKAKRYTDFRKMLDEMGKSIDAVTVSTPDHTHAPAALMAMRMGKHCFCQKPLTHSIYEARLMAKVAKEMKVATQMGNQGTAANPLRKAAAIVQSGALGAVKEVHVWTNRPIWPQGGARPEAAQCPKHLKWDLWLSAAKARPFANGYHPFSWRGWWDFGTGALGDMACHTVNMPYMALNLRDPIAIQAECAGHNKDSYPKWSIITFDYPALGKRPAVKLFWYDGGKKPDAELLEGKKMEASGCLIVGDKGKLYGPGDYCERELHIIGGASMPRVKWTHSPGHFEEWVLAIQGGEAARSNFADYSGGLSETILLGNLAVWAAASGKGEKVEWDAKNLRSPNTPGLEPIIKPTYRPGYTLDV